MTLIVSVTGRESVWLLADRRLSYRGRRPRDDGRKLMFLETVDGKAILGYSGLGATALGTEPADWMSSVLRGRNVRLEESLAILASAIQAQLPRHLAKVPSGTTHTVLVPAVVESQPRLYAIETLPDARGGQYRSRFVRLLREAGLGVPPRITVAGSGAPYLTGDTHWQRPVLRLVAEYERGRVSARAVATHLARVNNDVQRKVGDGTVGPRCIVAWRNRLNAPGKEGGGHQFYNGTVPESDNGPLPTIARGMDVTALVKVTLLHVAPMLQAMLAGDSNARFDERALSADVALLPYWPDEKLP